MRRKATFDDEGVKLDELAKINFIYGGNGTGKTTISNFLADSGNPDYAYCNCDWQDGEHEKIVVYNKKFREATILNSDNVPGVFTLGEESTEKIKEIREIKTKIAQLVKERDAAMRQRLQKGDELKALNEDLREWLWTHIYKAYPQFYEAYRGHMQKATFMENVLKVIGDGLHDSLPEADLTSRYKQLYSSSGIQNIALIDTRWYSDSLAVIEKNTIWAEKIIGKQDVPIASLVNSLNISDWVHRGKGILDQMEGDICPFCQQHTITDEFKRQIADFFDLNFVNKVGTISDLAGRYDGFTKNISLAFESLLQRVVTISDIEIDKDWFKTNIQAFLSILQSNGTMIEEKKKEPSRTIALNDSYEALTTIYDKVIENNDLITKHNQLADNIELEKRTLVKEIWNYLANIAKSEVDRVQGLARNLESAIKGLSKTYDKKKADCAAKESVLQQIEGSITSVLPTVRSINETLKQFGFTNFMIVETGDGTNQYQIQREDGTIATQTLSEGELTFISFLYYMHLIKGSHSSDSVSGNRILVIDDPISSLDSDVLFVVSSLLKELFKKVRSKVVIRMSNRLFF